MKIYKAITYCDFGELNRKDILSKHCTYETAFRQYPRLWRIYHGIHGWKVWVEKYEDN